MKRNIWICASDLNTRSNTNEHAVTDLSTQATFEYLLSKQSNRNPTLWHRITQKSKINAVVRSDMPDLPSLH